MTAAKLTGVANEVTLGWVVVFQDPDGLEIHLHSREHHEQGPVGRPGRGRPAAHS